MTREIVMDDMDFRVEILKTSETPEGGVTMKISVYEGEKLMMTLNAGLPRKDSLVIADQILNALRS